MATDICGCPGEQPTFMGTVHDVGMYSSMCSTEAIKSFSETRMSVKWITFHLGHLEAPLIIAIQVLFFPPKVQSMHLFPAWNPLNVECLVYIGCSANRRSMSEWLNKWIHVLSVPPGQRSNTLACPARPWPADLAHLPDLILHPLSCTPCYTPSKDLMIADHGLLHMLVLCWRCYLPLPSMLVLV